jgi:hypothetical protein
VAWQPFLGPWPLQFSFPRFSGLMPIFSIMPSPALFLRHWLLCLSTCPLASLLVDHIFLFVRFFRAFSKTKKINLWLWRYKDRF